jgi:hypothetical protein
MNQLKMDGTFSKDLAHNLFKVKFFLPSPSDAPFLAL